MCFKSTGSFAKHPKKFFFMLNFRAKNISLNNVFCKRSQAYKKII